MWASTGITVLPVVIGVALGGVVGIFLLAEKRVLGGASAQAAFDAIENGDANAESAEIDAGYDAHENLQAKVFCCL
jgi:hypothetical protein